MRILISADTYFPQVNGCSYFTQRLAYNLQSQGHEVRVIAPSEKFKNTDTVIHSVRVFGVHSYPILFYPKFRFCLLLFRNAFVEKVIDDFKPDVIHIQAHFAVNRMVVKYALKKKIPVVATNHFMPENLVHYVPFHSVIGPPIIKFAWNDFSKVYKKAGRITTPTATAARLIQPYFPTTVIPISCGINLNTFNPKNNGEYLKERYNIKALPILLYVGRLDKEKNVDFVIKALAETLKKTKLQFIIAGSGAERNNLKELSKTLGIESKVIFTGFVPDIDLPNLYAIADCFIIAGTAELQSIVTMEAMASGLPVLGVNAVALPELVRDGQNGFLFKDGDIQDLSTKMTRIFSDQNLRKSMSAKSLEFIAAHDIASSTRKFEEVYKAETMRKAQ